MRGWCVGEIPRRNRGIANPPWNFSDPPTLHFMISRWARLPQKHYSRFWYSGLTFDPPLSVPRSTSTRAWSVSRETCTFGASSQAVRILYLLLTRKSTSGQNENLVLGTSHLHSNEAFGNSARSWNLRYVSAPSVTISSRINSEQSALSRRTPHLWWFKQTKASARDKLILGNTSDLQLKTILETLGYINV